MTDVLSMPKTKKRLPYWPEKLTSETKIHGGKHYLCRRIFALAPTEYDWYLDAFGGAGSMTYNAPAVAVHTFNDKNYFRYLVKKVIRDNGPALESILRSVTYTEETFLHHKKKNDIDEAALKANCLKINTEHDVEIAASFIIRNRMSRGGLGTHFAWSDRLRGGQPGDLNAWCTMVDRIPLLTDRLKDVMLTNEDALSLIDVTAREAAAVKKRLFVYIDPPYPKHTRSTKAVEYGDDEMTPEQHEHLLDVTLKYPTVCFAVSTYNNALYDGKLSDWRREEFSMPNHAGQGETKERRFEILYYNY